MSRTWSLEDVSAMRAALAEAEKARGITGFRPEVGCVIVRNGRVICRGHTGENGLTHAEVAALNEAGERARGATLYSTLEPCHHNSQGVACDVAIVKAGVARVVFGARDPAEKNGVGAHAWLAEKGVDVEGGVLDEECSAWHASFLRREREKRPFVFVSVAMSLDGKIAWAKERSPVKFSSPEMLERVHAWRSQSDAIMVSERTVRIDDPALNARVPGAKQPLRAIVDKKARLNPAARLFGEAGGAVLVLTIEKKTTPNVKKLAARGAQIVVVPAKNGRVHLTRALQALFARGVRTIMLEGGGELIAGAHHDRLIDEWRVDIGPLLVGGRDTPTPLGGDALESPSMLTRVSIQRVERVGKDLLVIARPEYPAEKKRAGAR